MATQKVLSPREQEAQQRRASILADMEELWGNEKTLIVMNMTNGVVSIGFGDKGDEGGESLERTKLPINLTEKYSPDIWRKSSDFRKAIAKGWLKLVSEDDARQLWDADLSRKEVLARAAAKETQPAFGDATIHAADDDDAPPRAMVVDEDSSTLVDAETDPRFQRMMEYDDMHPASPKMEDPGATVNGETVSSRVLALVAGTKNGAVAPLDALIQLDNDEKLLTDSDLEYVVKHGGYEQLRKQAKVLLRGRIIA